MRIAIAGLSLDVAPFTDRDLLLLTSALGDFDGPYEVSEGNAVKVLRKIFPGMPPQWTQGDYLNPPLHQTTLSMVCQQLQEYLVSQPEYLESLEPLRAIAPEVSREIDKLAGFAKPVQRSGNSYRKQKHYR